VPREISVRWKFHGDGEHKPADYPEVKDLKSPRVIKIKGLLFLLIAILASAQILALHPDWHTAILLACAIWGACRFYYFAFYVIGHYTDPSFKFAGLLHFVRYLIRGK